MKTRILALFLILAIFCATVITVSAEGTAVSANDVTANVGDTVTLAVSVSDIEAIVSGSIALAFDSNALELVSGSWVLPNNPIIADFKIQEGIGVFSYINSSSALGGAIFEAQFKLLEDVKAVNDVEFTVTLTNTSKEKVVNEEVAVGHINVSPSTTAEVCISDKITVFEVEALYVATDAAEPIVTLNKGSASYPFLIRNHLTKELTIKVGNVNHFLYDADANKILLDDVNPTDIALVYNDVNGTLRCYVNGNIAYYYTSAETPIMINDFVIDSPEFIAASGEESIAYGKGVTLNNAYNIGDSGTAQIIAYQEHNDENAIRILAGVDMPWYMSVGFELEVYKDGVGKGVEICSSQTIFESILSTSSETRIDIKATEYGYNYFAAMVIKGVDVSDGADYYIQITPFTTVGETKYCGTTAKINIDSQGNYSFE